MNMPAKSAFLCLVVLAIFACASAPAPILVNPLVPQTDQENAVDVLLDHKGYAGKTPTRRIRNSRFSGWSYVDRQHIIATFGVNTNYLIKFKSPCHDAQSAQTLRFDTVMSTIIPGDQVFVGPGTRIERPCWIDSIYELEKKPRGTKK